MFQFGIRYKSDDDVAKEATPGPGAYETSIAAIGKQTLSKNANVPEVKIGTGQRFAQYKDILEAECRTPSANVPRWVRVRPPGMRDRC